ncbi:putative major facilitator superfamily transporter [Diaporthe ampelina]|uniref:Putative major facilitator superfamily transporter n=1 Tax=Diaporthe ampelina TaxID=1214573 RepID=A0A0G2FL60_9PEZI|nr:putative major facilitator superfamily transporter [Diaporthe ampelina]
MYEMNVRPSHERPFTSETQNEPMDPENMLDKTDSTTRIRDDQQPDSDHHKHVFAKDEPEPSHQLAKPAGESGESDPQEPEDESHYPKPAAMAVIMVAVSMAMFLVSLDRTIVSTAIPKITDEFHSSGQIGWYASAYQLTGCAMQLPLGRFYSFYSPKWVYLTLVLIFIVGSAVGAGAMSSNAVIVGRAVQGIGLGGVLSGSTILVTDNAPLRRRPMFLGILMASMSISACIGPLIGGALTTSASWRWCFIINIPIGLFIMVILAFFVKATRGKKQASGWADKIRHLDPLGAAMLLPCVVCFILALQWAGSTYPWSDWRIIILFVFGGVLAIGFIASQILRPETATVPPRIASQRTVFASCFFATMSGGAMMVVTYWISIWFQAVQGVNAVESGKRTIALVLSQAVGAILGGGLGMVIGYPSPIMMLSAIFTAVGSGLLSTMKIHASEGEWIGYQVLVGLGLGFATQQPSMAIQTVLAKDDIPTGISLVFFGMQFGGSIFVCAGQNVFNQKLSWLLDEANIPGLDVSTVLSTGSTQLKSLVSNQADLQRLLYIYNESLTTAFLVAAGVGAASVLGVLAVQWKSTKGMEPVH